MIDPSSLLTYAPHAVAVIAVAGWLRTAHNLNATHRSGETFTRFLSDKAAKLEAERNDAEARLHHLRNSALLPNERGWHFPYWKNSPTIRERAERGFRP